MTQAVATTEQQEPNITAIEKAVYQGNIAELTPEQRVTYVNELCNSVGLNPLTRPMEYITLQGKLTLYVTRSGTDQLRKLHGVSIIRLDAEETEDLYMVTATAQDEDGRTDFAKGIVSLWGKDKNGNAYKVKGEDYANAVMKAETKAKRRVTLSICGLGFLDESEASGGGGGSAPRRDIEPPRAITEASGADVTNYETADPETGEIVVESSADFEGDPEPGTQAIDPDDAWNRIQTAMKAHSVTASKVAKAMETPFTKAGVTEYLQANPSETPEGVVERAAAG